MKKRFYTGLLLAALLLSGCSKPVEETPVQNATVVEPPPVQSGILSDVGQAETLQEYYDRTAIISRNEWMEGTSSRPKTGQGNTLRWNIPAAR